MINHIHCGLQNYIKIKIFEKKYYILKNNRNDKSKY